MDKRHEQYTAGEAVKDAYDGGVNGVFEAMWRGLKRFAQSGFGKGALITAAVIVASVAIVTGAMGVGGVVDQFVVNGTLVKTLERGLAEGITVGLKALIHPFGLAALAVGGATNAVVQHHHERAAHEFAELKRSSGELLEYAKGLEAKSVEQHVHVEAPKPQQQKIEVKEKSFTGAENNRREIQAQASVTQSSRSI